MIFVNSNKDVGLAYTYEALRRLWEASIDENGNFVNFDYYYNHSPKKDGRIYMPFEDVYCPAELQTKIIDEILKEPYCTPTGKVYKLNKSRYEQQIIYGATLGPSPWSSKESFAKRHPIFDKIKEKFD